jgi:hypothetical protein
MGTGKIGGGSLGRLIERAGMDVAHFESGVVPSSDGRARIAVGRSSEPEHIDYVRLEIMIEGDGDRLWQRSHFSPARARVLARHPVAEAKRLEALDANMRRIAAPVRASAPGSRDRSPRG